MRAGNDVPGSRGAIYRLCDQPLFGAPAERNVLVDEYVEQSILLRWSEETLMDPGFYRHSVPPGLDVGNANSLLEGNR